MPSRAGSRPWKLAHQLRLPNAMRCQNLLRKARKEIRGIKLASGEQSIFAISFTLMTMDNSKLAYICQLISAKRIAVTSEHARRPRSLNGADLTQTRYLNLVA